MRSSPTALAATVTGPDGAPTCIILHGVGTTSWMWRGLVDRLEGAVRLVMVDLPGHGHNASRPWVSIDDTVLALTQIIDETTVDGIAHVVGLSLGGYLALEITAAHPEKVESALVSGVNVLPFPRPRLMRATGHLMASFVRSGVMLRANARSLAIPPEDYQGYVAAARSMAKGTFTAIGEELMNYRLPATAATCPTRVLATAGANEHPLILESLTKIAAAFPHAQARIAPAVGHAWNGQNPDLFAQTVLAHITSQPLPTELADPDLAGNYARPRSGPFSVMRAQQVRDPEERTSGSRARRRLSPVDRYDGGRDAEQHNRAQGGAKSDQYRPYHPQASHIADGRRADPREGEGNREDH
ncbi:alpha/beta hydrolase [Arthrobacter sp. MSA 4-2]|nr:alpha/beta hydrolase [Arthrobacter sp. MSA 4-2]